MKKYISIIAATLITALILVACGGTTGPGASEEPSAESSPTAEFLALTTGQPAAMVFGQDNFESQRNTNSLKNVLGGVGAPLIADGKLYIPDASGGRIMGYSSVPTKPGAAANFAIGRASLQDVNEGHQPTAAPTPKTLSQPTAVFTDGENLYAVDPALHRIVRYEGFPDQNGAEATWVLGQPDMFSEIPTCTPTGMRLPSDATIAGGKLIVADTGNNRVLIWNQVPSVPNTPADLVLGQPNLTSCDMSAATRNTLSAPRGVWSDGTRLLVVDEMANRVLVWDTFPEEGSTEPDWVLGQPNFVSQSVGKNAGADELYGPTSITSNGTQIFVADGLNNRVLIWNEFPTSDGPDADVVIGQSDFAKSFPNAGAGPIKPSAFNYPRGLLLHENSLIVSDFNNHRYLVFEPR